jgi:hypothetical protein
MNSDRTLLVACFVVLAGAAAISVPAQECAIDAPEWAPRGSANSAKPRISVTLTSSCGAAIDVGSVHMTIDDEAVMPTTDGTGAKVVVTYTPTEALVQEADHTVAVRAQDAKGTRGEKIWTFHLGDTYSR